MICSFPWKLFFFFLFANFAFFTRCLITLICFLLFLSIFLLIFKLIFRIYSRKGRTSGLSGIFLLLFQPLVFFLRFLWSSLFLLLFSLKIFRLLPSSFVFLLLSLPILIRLALLLLGLSLLSICPIFLPFTCFLLFSSCFRWFRRLLSTLCLTTL